MLLTKEGFSFVLEAMAAVGVDGIGLDEEPRSGAKGFFFEEEGSIAIDSDMHLCCLLRNLTLKLEAISSSSFSSQIIGDSI
ncbi:hypothetical protein PVL29_003726 [Vitis rotundifolia]|uniref:Uncharacterized protein n=1 Tax=Vitis rotundifolia TaxID=103349 RepID=A0AA39AEU9_VITRO|nr:hypothetical protein PVL29_003726 [Vitis rotundifolia]